jgi:hypothetical protein
MRVVENLTLVEMPPLLPKQMQPAARKARS